MTSEGVESTAQVIDTPRQSGERSRHRVQTLVDRLELTGGIARRRGRARAELTAQRFGLRSRLLDGALKGSDVGPKLEDFVLRRKSGDVGAGRATTKEQRDGEDANHCPRRRWSGTRQRAFVRKWARRFLAQHASLCSVQIGRSSP